jgi:hypothetical protein
MMAKHHATLVAGCADNKAMAQRIAHHGYRKMLKRPEYAQ